MCPGHQLNRRSKGFCQTFSQVPGNHTTAAGLEGIEDMRPDVAEPWNQLAHPTEVTHNFKSVPFAQGNQLVESRFEKSQKHLGLIREPFSKPKCSPT